MGIKKDLNYYINLDWSYTIEQESSKGKHYYIIRVNELPGICTDAETVEEGMQLIQEAVEGAIRLYLKNGEEIPEPVKKDDFKGNIAYRTSSERHYKVAKLAREKQKSISKTLDDLIDVGISSLTSSSEPSIRRSPKRKFRRSSAIRSRRRKSGALR